jgi:hypothetical protein
MLSCTAGAGALTNEALRDRKDHGISAEREGAGAPLDERPSCSLPRAQPMLAGPCNQASHGDASMTPPDLTIRPAVPEDLPRLQAIRAAAFAPVLASFREILGDTIYEVAQARDDEAQAALLDDCFEPDSVWRLRVAESRNVGRVPPAASEAARP